MKRILFFLLFILYFTGAFSKKVYYDAYNMQTWSEKRNCWSANSPVNTRISFEYLAKGTVVTIGVKSADPLRLIVYSMRSEYTKEEGYSQSFKEDFYMAFKEDDFSDLWTVRFIGRTPNGKTQIYLDHNNYSIKYNVKYVR